MSADHRSLFARFARHAAIVAGRPLTFFVAISLVIAWVLIGPMLEFSNTWQLMINTATTIVTVLMVFLIQNTQNRDSEALQIKLDEIIRATRGARKDVLDLEELDEAALDAIRVEYLELAERARQHIEAKKRS